MNRNPHIGGRKREGERPGVKEAPGTGRPLPFVLIGPDFASKKSLLGLCKVVQALTETFLLQRKARLHPPPPTSQRASTALLLGSEKRQFRGVATPQHRVGDSEPKKHIS